MRTNSPIYVTDQIILEESEDKGKDAQLEVNNFKKFIDDLKPSDFTQSDED